MVNKMLSTLFRRFRNPFVLGEITKFSPQNDRETVLLTLRNTFEKAAGPKEAPKSAVVAFSREKAEHMSLRKPFLIVCSPVNYRRDPEQRSGIVALPLPTDEQPRPSLKAA